MGCWKPLNRERMQRFLLRHAGRKQIQSKKSKQGNAQHSAEVRTRNDICRIFGNMAYLCLTFQQGGDPKSPLFCCITNMGTLTAIIRDIAEAATSGSDVFIISVTANRNETVINIAIDADTALSMEKITQFSRAVSKAVDERDPGDHKFTLEIGSPGADQPLQDLRQLPKHIGRNVHAVLKDGRECQGKLIQVEGSLLQLEIPGLKKKDPATSLALQWDEMAKITIDLKY